MSIPSIGHAMDLGIISITIPPPRRRKEEIQHGDEETPSNNQDTRLLNRLGPFVPHILGDLRCRP
jgi:hypothetical protein